VAAICVFCSSSAEIPVRYVDLATQVGAELARRGHSLVSGGGSVSCMGAVARAARAGGAHTVGVIADELIVTVDMRSRKAEMDRRSDAFLVLPGGLGTLEEMIEVWVAAVLSMHAKPVVVLDPDGVFDPLREQVERLVTLGFVQRTAADALRWVHDVPAAFAPIEAPEPTPRATI
jgi:uncharacterized protein (TIGR00730 family)